MKNSFTNNKGKKKSQKLLRSKKTFVQLTVIALIMALSSGCSPAAKGKDSSFDINKSYFNKEHADIGMKTVSGDKFDYDKEVLFGKFGISLGSPVINELKDRFTGFDNLDSLDLLYFNDKSLELGKEVRGKDFESLDESLLQEMEDNDINYGSLFYVNEHDDNTKAKLKEYKDRFSIVEPFAKNGEYTYYYAYNDDFSAYSKAVLSDSDKANIEKLTKDMANICKHSALFPFGESSVCAPMIAN